ncbi:MspA family porin [Nocardia sp. NPDC049526]|uniref:MspA family porin n=1 Tax=Nocardia sp. NPDC049526 TaxID=3364316 RepID=UPI0037A55B0F
MRPRFVFIATGVVVAVLAVVLWSSVEPSRAQPPGADVSGAGVHVTTSVESVNVDPAGDRMPNFLMTFAHAAQLSGDYSLNVEGDGVMSGQAVAGFLLGCAISLDNGFTVGIDPNQGLAASISPEFSQSNVAATLPNATLTTVPATPRAATTSQSATTPQSAATTSQSAAVTPQSVAATSQSAAVTPQSVAAPQSAAAAPQSAAAAPQSAAAAPQSAAAAPQSAAATPQSAATTPQSAATTSQSAATTPQSADTTSPSVETTSPSVETTSPSVETTSPSASAPSASLGPTVGGALGLTQVLEATLAPGQITTVTTVTTDLDNQTVFPYHFIFNNAALNVGQCASPVSAVPFITATVSTAVETVQTTAYGRQFTF